ncbi:MAG: glycoside hydrolase family 127 protein [Planctomycetia bacterium]|nr:glycoside hydrolase family 127 protein [Planctomycetia bacterium]
MKICRIAWFMFLLVPSLPAEEMVFPETQVRLCEGPFLHAQEMNRKYLLELDADRLLAPYFREAGLPTQASPYGNWESSGLDGHIAGHYLSALAHLWGATEEVEIRKRLDYAIAELEKCQIAHGNGYLGGVPNGKPLWEALRDGKIESNSFGLNRYWVPIYNLHKMFAGLRDAAEIAGSVKARAMFLKFSDWFVEWTKNLSDDQIQTILRTEHGGINETLADAFAISGDEKYLRLAERFSHREILDPLLEGRDNLTGKHANTQIPKVIGFQRIADLARNDDWHTAAVRFWENVVFQRSIAIGGNSFREHFNDVRNFEPLLLDVEGPETCNTYNMLRLTRMLFARDPSSRYADFYEKALFNHILSTQNPRTGGLVYFTPARSGHYRVYSQPQTCFWCCVGSGMENHAKYGEMIYAHTEKTLFVNLFIASRFSWKEKSIEVLQQTRFPDEDFTEITLNPEKPTTLEVRIRRPHWATSGVEIAINGENVPVCPVKNGYISLTREWKKGDTIRVAFPMKIHVETPPDRSAWYAIFYGPILLAAPTDTKNQTGLFADEGRGAHIAHGPKIPLAEIPVLPFQPDEIAKHVHPVQGADGSRSLHFRIDGMTATLIPFFRVHETRYVMYWKTIFDRMVYDSADSVCDVVYCGEQQPETDHAVAFKNSVTGTEGDLHWRQARPNGWFSFQFPNAKHANILRIRTLPVTSEQKMTVWVNGEPIPPLTETETERTYSLPAASKYDVCIRSEETETPKVICLELQKE